MSEFFNAILPSISVIGALIGLGASLVAAISSLIAKRSDEDISKSDPKSWEPKNDPEEDSRLSQIRGGLKRQQTRYNWYSASSAIFTFSQYIIGAALASSFIQDNFDKKLVGWIGIIVLMSSIINRHYRPDLHALQARRRMYKAQRLVREIEDDLFFLQDGGRRARSMREIRKRASEGLAELEDSELFDAEKIRDEISETQRANNQNEERPFNDQ